MKTVALVGSNPIGTLFGRMAEQADAPDLKSGALAACGFESRSGHQINASVCKRQRTRSVKPCPYGFAGSSPARRTKHSLGGMAESG